MNTTRLRVAGGIALLLAALALSARGVQVALSSAAADFAVENGRAMEKMMTAMTIEPSGNVDRDFVAMIVPHHQGAIDMAVAELRFGTDETLRRMAQEIIVDQQQEIVAMRLAANKLAGLSICTAVPSDARTGGLPTQHAHDAHAQAE